MHRESIYVCTYGQGADRIVGRVRAWDIREAAQLFAFELETEDGARRIGAREVTVRAARRPSAIRRRRPASSR